MNSASDYERYFAGGTGRSNTLLELHAREQQAACLGPEAQFLSHVYS